MTMLDDVRKNASKPQAHHGKALLHGLPGTGKTQAAGTIAGLGDTLFLYVRGEEGINTLTDHENADNLTIHQVASVKEMDEIQNELALGGHGFKGVAIDSVSAYQTMVSKWLLGLPQDAPAKDRPATDYTYWGQLRDYFTDFFTFWYGLANSSRGEDAMHVVMTAQTKMLEDATGEERMQPELFKGPLAAAVSRSDLICYMHMGADPEDMGKQRHLVRVKPSAYVVAKTRCSPDTYDKLPEVLGTNSRFTLPKFFRALHVAGTDES